MILNDIEQRVMRVLDLVGLPDFADVLPATSSCGQKRLVAVARAIVDEPAIIYLDEPTSGLDPITARRMCETIIRLRDLENATMLFVTHKLDNVRYLSSNFMTNDHRGDAVLRPEIGDCCLLNSRILVLRHGRATFEGTDEELWQVDDPYLRDFTAMS